MSTVADFTAEMDAIRRDKTVLTHDQIVSIDSDHNALSGLLLTQTQQSYQDAIRGIPLSKLMPNLLSGGDMASINVGISNLSALLAEIQYLQNNGVTSLIGRTATFHVQYLDYGTLASSPKTYGSAVFAGYAAQIQNQIPSMKASAVQKQAIDDGYFGNQQLGLFQEQRAVAAQKQGFLSAIADGLKTVASVAVEPLKIIAATVTKPIDVVAGTQLTDKVLGATTVPGVSHNLENAVTNAAVIAGATLVAGKAAQAASGYSVSVTKTGEGLNIPKLGDFFSIGKNALVSEGTSELKGLAGDLFNKSKDALLNKGKDLLGSLSVPVPPSAPPPDSTMGSSLTGGISPFVWVGGLLALILGIILFKRS